MADPAITHYDVLGVAPTVAPGELRDAYVALARRHHPDVSGGDARRMRAINAAWSTLGDPVRRARYDQSLAGWPAAEQSTSAEDGDHSAALEDLLADLDDDAPIGGTVVLPQWMSLVPVALFVLSVLSVALGALMGVPALLGLGVMAFLVSSLLFIAAPFLALLASRRSTR